MIKSCDLILVEDNTSDAELAIRILHKIGLGEKLLHLEDGEALLEYVFGTGRYSGRNTAENPKLIIMDLKMPKVSGLEALQQIRQKATTRYIPVVLLTSSQEENDLRSAYALGVNSFVVKPLEFGDYVKVVSSISNYWLLINQHCI